MLDKILKLVKWDWIADYAKLRPCALYDLGFGITEQETAPDHAAFERLLDKLLSKEPEHPMLLNDKGLLLEIQGQYSAALECFEKSLKAFPNNPMVRLKRAHCLHRIGNREAAHIEYDWFIKQKAPSEGFLEQMLSPLQDDQLTGIEARLQDRGTYYVDYATTQTALIFTENGNYEEAVTVYDTINASSDFHLHAQCGKAQALSSLGRYEEALAVFGEIVCNKTYRELPWICEAWISKGSLHEMLQDDDNALACYQEALEVNQGAGEALIRSAIILYKQGNAKDSIVLLERCLMPPATSDTGLAVRATRLLAECHICLDDYAAALVVLENGLQENACDIGLWLDKGGCLWQMDRKEEAIGAFKEAHKMDPNNVDAILCLADSYMCLNDFKQGIEFFRMATERSNDVDVSGQLALALVHSGDRTAALSVLDQFEKRYGGKPELTHYRKQIQEIQ